MYFWDTGALAGDLQNETVTDAEQVPYLLASVVLCEIGAYLLSWVPIKFTVWSFLDGVVTVAAMVIGILLCAKANREGDNKNLLSRLVCLSWPLGVRFFVLMIPTALGVDLIMRVLGLHTNTDEYQQNWDDVLLSVVFSALLIWRLRRWIRVVSGQTASV